MKHIKEQKADSGSVQQGIAASPMLPAVSRQPPCERHKNFCQNMNMLDWFAEMERREKKGMKQKQCPRCKRWYFKDEY